MYQSQKYQTKAGQNNSVPWKNSLQNHPFFYNPSKNNEQLTQNQKFSNLNKMSIQSPAFDQSSYFNQKINISGADSLENLTPRMVASENRAQCTII